MESVQNIINAIQMIHSVSPYYSVKENISALFIKVSEFIQPQKNNSCPRISAFHGNIKNVPGHKSDGYSMQIICDKQWHMSNMGPRSSRPREENAGDNDTSWDNMCIYNGYMDNMYAIIMRIECNSVSSYKCSCYFLSFFVFGRTASPCIRSIRLASRKQRSEHWIGLERGPWKFRRC